jgi:hypothetical protein
MTDMYPRPPIDRTPSAVVDVVAAACDCVSCALPAADVTKGPVSSGMTTSQSNLHLDEGGAAITPRHALHHMRKKLWQYTLRSETPWHMCGRRWQ